MTIGAARTAWSVTTARTDGRAADREIDDFMVVLNSALPRSALISWYSAARSIWTLQWLGTARSSALPARTSVGALVAHTPGRSADRRRSADIEDACVWHPVIRALEAQKPLWKRARSTSITA
jgi:hypothetical protein